MVNDMNKEILNKKTYYLLDENDIFIDNDSSNDNSKSFNNFTMFWLKYLNYKNAILKYKRNSNYNMDNYNLRKSDLSFIFYEEGIPKKYQKLILIVTNNRYCDGYEPYSETEFDLTTFNKTVISEDTYIFGKSYDDSNTYICFKDNIKDEEEITKFMKDLKEQGLMDNYKNAVNRILNKKVMCRSIKR